MNFRPGAWFAVVKYIGNADRTRKWEMCSWIICQQVGLGLVSPFLNSLCWKSPTLCLPWNNQMLGSNTLALNTASYQKQPGWIKSLFLVCLFTERINWDYLFFHCWGKLMKPVFDWLVTVGSWTWTKTRRLQMAGSRFISALQKPNYHIIHITCVSFSIWFGLDN